MGKSEKRHPKNRTLFKYGSGSRTSFSDESDGSNEIWKKCYNETNSEEKEEEEEGKNQTTWIIDALPNRCKPKAYSLLRYIIRNYNMKWTSDGTFKYKNKVIPKSNILHLV